MAKKIYLTQNQYALVDDWNYDYLSGWKWFAKFDKGANTYYAARNEQINGKRYTVFMHRVIAKTPKGFRTDHKDHDGLNNLEDNLRTATSTQNNANRNRYVNNTSGYKGVSWYKQTKKWIAGIGIESKNIHLGYFNDPEDAAKAYDIAAVKYFGEFAKTNF